jgi:hypothetical protein
MCFVWFSLQTAIISLNSVNRLISVMVKWGVFFAVSTEFLNIMQTSFGLQRVNTALSLSFSVYITWSDGKGNEQWIGKDVEGNSRGLI